MTEPIRVLQVVASLNAGGMENYIMNLYRMVDKSKVQFDFVVHHAAVGLYEDEIQELGGKIYHFTVLDDKNVVKYISELNRFFDEHKEYQIIHGHLMLPSTTRTVRRSGPESSSTSGSSSARMRMEMTCRKLSSAVNIAVNGNRGMSRIIRSMMLRIACCILSTRSWQMQRIK